MFPQIYSLLHSSALTSLLFGPEPPTTCSNQMGRRPRPFSSSPWPVPSPILGAIPRPGDVAVHLDRDGSPDRGCHPVHPPQDGNSNRGCRSIPSHLPPQDGNPDRGCRPVAPLWALRTLDRERTSVAPEAVEGADPDLEEATSALSPANCFSTASPHSSLLE